MLVELNCTAQANYQNQIMANFEQISPECGSFSLRMLLLQQLETYDSVSGWNIETPAGVDSGTPVCVHLWHALRTESSDCRHTWYARQIVLSSSQWYFKFERKRRK